MGMGLNKCTRTTYVFGGLASLSLLSFHPLCFVQMNCAIRGSHLELYKNDSLVTKLFLPGVELIEDLDSKRSWSFKLKNPRREETLHLAAEGETDYQKWIVALNKACSIQVSSYPAELMALSRMPLVGICTYTLTQSSQLPFNGAETFARKFE